MDQDFIGSRERFLVLMRYMTVGIVKIVSILYSLDNLSLTISIWSIHRKPQRKPNPNALESSNSYSIALSLIDNFSKLSLSLS